MAYQNITFEITQPCSVDIGDGYPQIFPAGTHTITPKGYVIIENDSESEKLEQVKFKSDTIKEINIQKGEELLTAENMCKNLTNLTKFRLQGPNKIQNYTSMLENTSIKHLDEMQTINGTVFDKMLKDANDLICITEINTSNQTSTVQMFENTPSLLHPDLSEKLSIESGMNYVNSNICNDNSGPIVVSAPVLNIGTDYNDDATIVIKIINYNSSYTYNASVTGDFVSVHNDEIYWTLPNVAADETHTLTVYASKYGNVSASTINNITVHDTTYTPSAIGIDYETGTPPAFNNSTVNDLWDNLD